MAVALERIATAVDRMRALNPRANIVGRVHPQSYADVAALVGGPIQRSILVPTTDLWLIDMSRTPWVVDKLENVVVPRHPSAGPV